MIRYYKNCSKSRIPNPKLYWLLCCLVKGHRVKIFSFHIYVCQFNSPSLRARYYTFMWKLSSFTAHTFWFIDLSAATCHIQYIFQIL